MERARLEEEIKQLNRIYEMIEDELPEFFEFFNIEYNEEFIETLDDNKEENLLKSIVSNIERNLTPEDLDYFYEHIDTRIYPFLLNTERKIKKLQTNSYIDEYTKSDIVKSLETDEQKIPFIEELCSSDYISYSIASAIASLSSDTTKMKYIKTLVQKNNNWYDYNTIMIVKSLQDDSLKIGILDEVYDISQAEIISSFKDDAKKIEFLERLKNQGKAIVIASLQSEELKIEQLKKLEGIKKQNIVKSLKSDEAKLTFLNEFNEEEKIEIIKTFATDEAKIKALSMQKLEYNQAIIIGTLKDDIKKIELLEGVTQQESREKIISNIRSEQGRKLFLKRTQDQKEVKYVLKNFTKDEMIEFFSETSTQQKYPEIYSIYRKIYENASPSKKTDAKYTSFGLPPNMTIGVEIEAEGENSEIIMHARQLRGNKAKNDESLTDGVEVITGIMHDTKEDVSNIYEVANLMQDLGLTSSNNCRRTYTYWSRLYRNK